MAGWRNRIVTTGWSGWEVGYLNTPEFLTLSPIVRAIEYYAVDILGNVQEIHYEELNWYPPLES